jgi:hypothetical protein
MKSNMGTIDKALRTFLGLVILLLYFTGNISGSVAVVLLALSAILLLTSLSGVCLVYLPFHYSTCKNPSRKNNR